MAVAFPEKGEVTVKDQLLLTLDREELSGKKEIQTAHLCIKTDFARVNVEIQHIILKMTYYRISTMCHLQSLWDLQ